MHVAPRIVVHCCPLSTIFLLSQTCPKHAPQDDPDMPQTSPRWCPRHAGLCPRYTSQCHIWYPQLACFLKNIVHDGSFQHCTWLLVYLNIFLYKYSYKFFDTNIRMIFLIQTCSDVQMIQIYLDISTCRFLDIHIFKYSFISKIYIRHTLFCKHLDYEMTLAVSKLIGIGTHLIYNTSTWLCQYFSVKWCLGSCRCARRPIWVQTHGLVGEVARKAFV